MKNWDQTFDNIKHCQRHYWPKSGLILPNNCLNHHCTLKTIFLIRYNQTILSATGGKRLENDRTRMYLIKTMIKLLVLTALMILSLCIIVMTFQMSREGQLSGWAGDQWSCSFWHGWHGSGKICNWVIDYDHKWFFWNILRDEKHVCQGELFCNMEGHWWDVEQCQAEWAWFIPKVLFILITKHKVNSHG